MAHGSSGGSKAGGFSMAQFMNDFVIGGTAGAIAKTVVAPLERVKLLMQTQHANPKLVARPYTGMSNCFYRVLTEEGVTAFWRGMLFFVRSLHLTLYRSVILFYRQLGERGALLSDHRVQLCLQGHVQ